MHPTEVATELERARMLLAARRFEEAAQLAKQCVGSRPDDPEPLILDAWAELALRHWGAAESAARAAIGCAPLLSEAHRVLVVVLTSRAYATNRNARGRMGGRALQAAKELARLAPTDVASARALADAAVAAGKPRVAVAASNTVLQLDPNSAQTWLIRGRAARAAYDFPVAEACIREALRLEPDDYLANNELGLILRLRGRTSDALQQFASSASIDPLARPARTNLLRYGAIPFLVLTLILTSPTLLLLHGSAALWIWGSLILNGVLWRVAPTKKILERQAMAIALWRSRLPRRRSKRREAIVPPTTPIQPYRSRLTVSILFLLLLIWIAALATGGIANSAPPYLPLTLLIDVPTVIFARFVFKRATSQRVV